MRLRTGGIRSFDISQRKYYSAILIVSAVSLWIGKGIPLTAYPFAVHDDQLFIRTAQDVLAGQWLGPYNNLTLAKGMFYPFFIALSYRASISLKFAEHLVYLCACALIATIVKRTSGKRWLAAVLFALLAMNPFLWNPWLARVTREGLYTGLSLAVFGLFTLIAFPKLQSQATRRLARIALGFGLGAVTSCYWLTREEGIWLVPAVIAVLSFAIFEVARSRSWSESLKNISVPLTTAAVAFAAGFGWVAYLNYRHYGVFETNDLQSSSFLRAYGALQRIEHNHWKRYVPFPIDARQRAYQVSPAARELSTSLDGGLGATWRDIACSARPEIHPCNEILGGWFMWALRDAVARAGHYHSAREANEFYERLASEINGACDQGRIPCFSRRASLVPPFRWEYIGDVVKSSKVLSTMVFTMGKGEVGPSPSVGSPQDIATFENFVGEVAPAAEGVTLRIDGWAASAASIPVIEVRPRVSGDWAQEWITIRPAHDVRAVYPTLRASRFSLETDCPIATCELAISGSGTQTIVIPLDTLHPGGTTALIDTSDFKIYADRISFEAPGRWSGGRHSLQIRIASLIASGFSKSCRLLSLVAVIGLLLSMIRRPRGTSSVLLALIVGSMVAVFTRIGLLASIDALSFPTRYLHYCAPASPFVIIFVVLGLYTGYCSLIRPQATDFATETCNPAGKTKLSTVPLETH